MNLSFIIHNLSFKKATPWVSFLAALIPYWLTVDPGASYWDCPEYLLSAIRLEIGHPPGNPSWLLFHRFVSSFFPDPALQVRVINMMAGLFTAFAVMMLCSVSISLMRWIWPPRRRGARWRSIAISVSSLVGTLCFAWSDSAWYSAVEAEVYAMSLFFTALSVRMALKWAFALSRASRFRWLVAMMYVIGFSIGVHQLNLLVLPAVAMIMAFRTPRRGYLSARRSFVRVSLAFLAGCTAVGFILKILIPGSVAIAEKADLFAVNSLGLPYWTGVITFWVLAISVAVAAALLLQGRSCGLSALFWSLAAVMVGLSVYALIPIRACANPPVNEGNPSDIFRFSDYLSRRQYGSAPLFYGRTPFSRMMRVERMSVSADGDSLYDYSWNAMVPESRDYRPMTPGARIPSRSRFITAEDRTRNSEILEADSLPGYVLTGYRLRPRFTPELNMWFPRIYASSPSDLAAYRDWTGMDSTNMVQVRISEAYDSLGFPVAKRDASGNLVINYGLRPSYAQSALYFGVYQVGYMYLRYLMWNYSGRQNDVPSTGEIDHGNFITGIAPVDQMMLGPQSQLPDELSASNHGRNVYFAIPFFLGVLGLIWLFCGVDRPRLRIRMRRVAWVSLVLFLMTGIAIVFYLNQSPGEPRERDYSFLGSFWTFALWIGFGVLLLLRAPGRRWARGVLIVAALSVPVWMLTQNWRDHDRSNRSATLDYASNLLESLPEDAVLFVDGDNFIFPLWYAQEVMGLRRDVAVVCNAYLGCDWYVRQLITPRYEFDGLRAVGRERDLALGYFNSFRLPPMDTDTVSAEEALRILYSDTAVTPALKHRWLRMGGKNSEPWVYDVLSMPGKSAGSLAGLRELATLDFVAANAAARYPRPIYWHQSLPSSKYCGFYPMTRQGLFARRLAPQLSDSVILIDEALDALPLMKWGGLDRAPYLGPDVASQAARQRASLIRLAQSLADAGRHDQALHVARAALVRIPPALVPFTIRSHADTVFREARTIADILRRSGTALSDTAAISEAAVISGNDSLRALSFRRYRSSLPPSRRSALSPASRNLSIP